MMRRVTCRILIVDDSESFLRAAAKLVAARGFEPLTACDGEAALAVVSGGCPDGIILDIGLPGRNGLAVAPLIAAACPAAVIVLTSSEIEHLPGTALTSCGAAAFVPKIKLAATDLETLFAGPGSRVRRRGQPGPDQD